MITATPVRFPGPRTVPWSCSVSARNGCMGRLGFLARGPFGVGEITVTAAQPGKHRLLVQALRVVDRGRDASRLETGRDGVSVRDPDGVLGVDVGCFRGDGWDAAASTELFGITRGEAGPRGEFLLEMGELGQENGGTWGVSNRPFIPTRK